MLGSVWATGSTPTGRTVWLICLTEIEYSLKRGWHSVLQKAAHVRHSSTGETAAGALHAECMSHGGHTAAQHPVGAIIQ
jgi:hypothetical protein